MARYGATFTATTEAGYLLPFKDTTASHRVLVPITKVGFYIFRVTNLFYQRIESGPPPITQWLCHKYDCTHDRFTTGNSKTKDSEVCTLCGCMFLRPSFNTAQVSLTSDVPIFCLRSVWANFINKEKSIGVYWFIHGLQTACLLFFLHYFTFSVFPQRFWLCASETIGA